MHFKGRSLVARLPLFSIPLEAIIPSFSIQRYFSSLLHSCITNNNYTPNLLHQSNVNHNNHLQGYNNDLFYYTSLIDASTQLSHLNQVHAHLIHTGNSRNELLISKMINLCANFGQVHYAHQLFDEIPQPNECTWNAIIRVFYECKMFHDLVGVFVRMVKVGVRFDCKVLARVLKGCCSCSNVEEVVETGRVVHGLMFKLGFDSYVFLQNGLVAFYAKYGRVGCAMSVFDGVRDTDRTVVSWTSIISGCAQNGQPEEALRLFAEMRVVNVRPDWINLVSVLRACTDLDDLDQGRSLHGFVIKLGLELEEDLRISLTALYAKCGQVIAARYLFDKASRPNLILWNAMISGYSKNGYADEAVELFKVMVARSVKPDSITVRAAIQACAQVGSLDLARWMNDYVSRGDCKNHVFVKTALIDMFAKCGSLSLAKEVFDSTNDKDVVAWSAMIVGYGLHGRGGKALDLYNAMRQAGIKPNNVTFVGLLIACKNSGLVKEGWDFFNSMRDNGIEPLHQHYACVVDLLGRAGYLGQAYKFITQMPLQPGLTIWGALLTACKIHRHVKLGEYAAGHLFTIDPYDIGHYVQLSNLYAAARMWDHVRRIRNLIRDKGLNKELGYSLIEINGKAEIFRMGDKSHPLLSEILKEHANLERKLKEAGFAPDIESNLHDLSWEDLHEGLCNHSERLAVAYGLIATPPGSTLWIIKNIRACVNCHSAIKLISKITKREIVIRDANRFHHLKDGNCSCGDFW